VLAPTDSADASGMNLMDVRTARWDDTLLAACAPGLHARLGEIVSPAAALGPIAPYFCRRYGLSPACRVVSCTGDNVRGLSSRR
jgi:xylulokinase